jgi:Tfp pilus assembly protein PilF
VELIDRLVAGDSSGAAERADEIAGKATKTFGDWLTLAIIRQMTKQPEKAEDALRAAISMDKTKDIAWKTLGVLLAGQSNRKREAEETIRKALELDPKWLDGWAALGDVLVNSNASVSQGTDAYRRAVELDPKSARVRTAYGRALWRLRKYAEAEEQLRVAVESDPKLAVAWGLLGEVLYRDGRDGDDAAAERAFLQASALDASKPDPYTRLAEIASRSKGRAAEATSLYEKSIALSKGSDVRAFRRYARFLDRQHKHDEAEKLLIEATTRAPESALSWHQLGLHLALTHRFERAEEALRRAIQIDPEDGLYWRDLGNVLSEASDRLNEAEASYRSATSKDPDVCAAWHSLGYFLIKNGRHEEGVKCLRTALEKNPSCSCGAASLAENLGPDLADEAERLLKGLMDKQPRNPWPHFLLAERLRKAGKDLEKSKSEYVSAIRKGMRESAPWEGLLTVLKAAGRSAESIQMEVKETVAEVGESSSVFNGVAWALHRSGIKEAAPLSVHYAQRARALNTGSWAVGHTLATTLADSEDYDGAIEQIRTLAEQVDDDVLQDFIDVCIQVAAGGAAKALAEQLEGAPTRSKFEPLIVALHLAVGRPVQVAQEVLEVAKDIVGRIVPSNQGAAS